jgi:hypothetical protein
MQHIHSIDHWLAQEIRRRQIAEAAEHRRGQPATDGHGHPIRHADGHGHPIRHAVGHALIRMGTALDGEHPPLRPARPR